MHLDNRLLLKVAEVAEVIGVSRAMAYKLVARGEIPSIRVGSTIKVPVETLRAWIANQLDEA